MLCHRLRKFYSGILCSKFGKLLQEWVASQTDGNKGLNEIKDQSRPTGELRAVDLSDDDLMAKRGSSGWAAAQGALFLRHYPAVLRAAGRIEADGHRAQDLAQEGILKTLRMVERGSVIQSFPAYAARAARNLAITQIASSREQVCSPDMLTTHESAIGVVDQCAEFVEDESLRLAMRTLSETYRTILWLTVCEGWGIKELANLSGEAPTAVAARAYRARNALKAAYNAPLRANVSA